MSDLIDRQAAIDALAKIGNLERDEEREYAVLLFGRIPSAQPEPQWIPYSEKLPKEEKKTYWICTDTGYQCECRWTNNRFGFGEGEWGWSIFDTPQYSKPIAWMPLPEPYAERRTDEAR